jgi:hypothetical protein
MQENNFEPLAALIGQGAAQYSPQKAPSEAGFGPWEVHPNKLPVKENDTVSVLWNGEFISLGEIDGKPYQLVSCGINSEFTARECAERICALNNGDKPTRVVDHLGREHVSRHTAASVQAELDRAAQSAE